MNDSAKKRHLAIIITRLTARRGAPDDEFLQDWDHNVDKDFIVISESPKAGPTILVIHGHDTLFNVSAPNPIEVVVGRYLQEAQIKLEEYTDVWFFVHGSLPNQYRLSPQASSEILGQIAKSKQFHPHPYSADGERSASNGLRKALCDAKVPNDLYTLFENKIKLCPTVTQISHEMQDLLLELRFVLEMSRSSQALSDQEYQKKRLREIVTQLHDERHLNDMAMKRVMRELIGGQSNRLTLEMLTFLPNFSVPDGLCFFDYSGNMISLDEMKDIDDEIWCDFSRALDRVVEEAQKMDRGAENER